MIVRTVNILPTALSLDDHIWDPHDGIAAWVPIVSLVRSGDYVEITLERDPEPLRLPAAIPIQVHRHLDSERLDSERVVSERVVSELVVSERFDSQRFDSEGAEEDESPFHGESAIEFTEHLAQLYIGDLAALRDAARAHRARETATRSAETPATAALRPLVAMYGGDLELVLEAIAGVAPDEVLTAARQAARSLALSNHLTPSPVADEQASNDDQQMVEDRLGGWYPGDLGALLPKPE